MDLSWLALELCNTKTLEKYNPIPSYIATVCEIIDIFKTFKWTQKKLYV